MSVFGGSVDQLLCPPMTQSGHSLLSAMASGAVRQPQDRSAILAGPQRDVIADRCGWEVSRGNKLLVPDGRPQVCLGVRRL